MGQKVSPIGLRVGVTRDWDAAWYADKKDVADLLHEDLKIRKIIDQIYQKAQVSKVVIERVKGNRDKKDKVQVTIHTARPGSVIGKDGEIKNKTQKELEYQIKKEVVLNIVEIKKPEIDALLVARTMAEQLEGRASFRRVQRVAIQRALKAGARGIKTSISGRLGGNEIARSEGYHEGRVPLHTIRADIDYALAEASTTYGKLGVKVWIYKGDVINYKNKSNFDRKVNHERKPYPQKREVKDNVNAKKNKI